MIEQQVFKISKDDLNGNGIANLNLCHEMIDSGKKPYFISGYDYYNDVLISTVEVTTNYADELLKAMHNVEELHKEYFFKTDNITWNHDILLEGLEELQLDDLDKILEIKIKDGNTSFIMVENPEVRWYHIDLYCINTGN